VLTLSSHIKIMNKMSLLMSLKCLQQMKCASCYCHNTISIIFFIWKIYCCL